MAEKLVYVAGDVFADFSKGELARVAEVLERHGDVILSVEYESEGECDAAVAEALMLYAAAKALRKVAEEV